MKRFLFLCCAFLSVLITFAQKNLNGHKFVDLGLSVKWATCNLGATSPSGYGTYWAWHETTKFDDASHFKKFSDGTLMRMYPFPLKNKKYVNIGIEIGGTQYDPVNIQWGDGWRMPTKSEFEELMANCDVERNSKNGINGYTFTSRINGKSIFLPCAGRSHIGRKRHDYDDVIYKDEVGECGWYLTGTMHPIIYGFKESNQTKPTFKRKPYGVCFKLGDKKKYYESNEGYYLSKPIGMSIRPVTVK